MSSRFNRREVLRLAAGAMIPAVEAGGFKMIRASSGNAMPSYLHRYEDLYSKDPRRAALAWFANADFGLFMHYGLYSLLGRVHGQLRELLTNYGSIAGIWFDPIMGFYSRPDLFPMEETYALVLSLQPQVLISFKQGATGTEDFAAPERSGHLLANRLEDPKHRRVAEHAWEQNKNKHNEICDTLQPRIWGYRKADDEKHLDADEVLKRLQAAKNRNCNLLRNTGPLPGGSIHPMDVKTLRKVGRTLHNKL